MGVAVPSVMLHRCSASKSLRTSLSLASEFGASPLFDREIWREKEREKTHLSKKDSNSVLVTYRKIGMLGDRKGRLIPHDYVETCFVRRI